jgi:formate/nitrite transporter
MADMEFNVDALMPPQMADKAEAVGIKKANLDFLTSFALAVLAGAFISAGAIFATTIMAGAGTQLTYGVTRLLGGVVFCLGLILVVVAGAELFTGNNLIVMAWANGKVSTGALLRNWVVVYLGNLTGALATVLIMFVSKQYLFGGGAVGITAVNTAVAKTNLGFAQAVALGIMCNALVCMAVWLCFSARSTTDKILSIIFPISAFVAAGFEHSIANMYFIPIGLLIKDFAGEAFWGLEAVSKAAIPAAKLANLTWGNFILANLVPVTLGNIIGGAGMVGLVYWFAYLRVKKAPETPAHTASRGRLAGAKR